MKLMTAHRILIGSSIAFFLFFAFLQLRNFMREGGATNLAAAAIAAAATAFLVAYFRNLRNR
jgi:hypothetical protein